MPTHAPPADARLPVRLPAQLLEELRELARVDGESLATTVRRILREAVRERRDELGQLGGSQ
jgi:hypothetical protein